MRNARDFRRRSVVVIHSDSVPVVSAKFLAAHPYRQFPVTLENKLQGVLMREEAEETITEKRMIKLSPGTVCLRDENIGKLQRLLIESGTQFVVLLDCLDGQVIGLVTLHDLLRAQTVMTQRSKEDD